MAALGFICTGRFANQNARIATLTPMFQKLLTKKHGQPPTVVKSKDWAHKLAVGR